MKWVVSPLLAGALVAVLLITSASHAQQEPAGEAGESAAPPQDPEAVLAELRNAYEEDPRPELLYQMGKLLFELERFDEAEVELRAYLDEAKLPAGQRKTEVQSMLYEISVSEHPLFRKAKHHLGVKQYVKAREALAAYLDDAGESITEVRRSQVKALMAEASAHIGSVTFSSNVQGASVYVSGVFVGSIPEMEPLELDEGEYPVEVGAGGYKTASKIVQVHGGQDKHIKVLLTRIGTQETCAGITCSGRGRCITTSGFPQCLCDEGFQTTSSGLECSPIHDPTPAIRSAAIAAIVLSAVGAAGMILGPILFVAEPAGNRTVGLGITIPAAVILSAGVPLGVETLAWYARAYKAAGLRNTCIGTRIWSIAGLSVATALLIPGMITGILPLTIIALTHYVALAATGISMGAKAMIAMGKRDEPGSVEVSGILPWVSPAPGGAAFGLAGTF